MKLEIDKSGDVERIFNEVVDEYPDRFEFLASNAIFQFTIREKPTYDEDGQEIAATAHRLSNRERDLYGSDFEICVYLPNWDLLSDVQKKRLIYHELLHCWVAQDEEDDTAPVYDNDGRTIIGIVPHDLIVKTFKAEIEEFGLQDGDLRLAEFFYHQYNKYLDEQYKKHNNVKKGRKRK